MNPTNAAFFIIGLIVGILAGWFVLYVLVCIVESRKRRAGKRADGPYNEGYDDGMEWVLGKDQQYRRVKKP